MPGTDASPSAPSALLLPRSALDGLIERALRGQALPLAHGPLVLQAIWPTMYALAGPLRPGPPQPLPADAAHSPAGPATDGLVLVALAPPDEAAPQGDDGWERWLQRVTPAFRLATPVLNPSLAVLWLRLDGQAVAAFRPGLPPPAPAARWQSVPLLRLPGAGLAQVRWPPTPPQFETALDVERRFSRQAGALGPATLARLQKACVAVVGAGRTGSVLAHGLVRMGVHRVLLMDPDTVAPADEDGDTAPGLEGRPKVEAVQRFLRGVARPGAALDARRLPVARSAAGSLLVEADLIACAVDNDAGRLWSNAWALAGNAVFLDIASAVRAEGAEVDLRLLPPGTGCLLCVGGLAQPERAAEELWHESPPATPADFRQQRRGSSRAWSAMAANLGLRMIERHVSGTLDRPLFRRLTEGPDGALSVLDVWPAVRLGPTCPLCGVLQGAGLAGPTPARLAAALAAATATPRPVGRRV